MKKIGVALFILMVGFIVAGCGEKQSSKQDAEGNSMQTKEEQQNNDFDKESRSQAKYVGEQIESAIKKGETLECTYRSSEEGAESVAKVYVSGDKYRSTVSINGEEFTTVFDGETQYSWSSSGENGMKMKMECVEDMEMKASEESDIDEFRTASDVLDQDVEMSCNKAGDIDFDIPNNVDFIDQCEILQQMQQIPDLQENLPEGLMQQMQNMN